MEIGWLFFVDGVFQCAQDRKEGMMKKLTEIKLEFISEIREYFVEQGLSVFEVAKKVYRTPTAVRYQLKKYFPKEYAAYKTATWKQRPKWKDEYLPELHRIVAQGGGIDDIMRRFDIVKITAQRWVRIHLGDDVYNRLVPEWKTALIPPKVKERAREMGRQGYFAEEIASSLGIPDEAITSLLRGI